jgi:hypothetical protein
MFSDLSIITRFQVIRLFRRYIRSLTRLYQTKFLPKELQDWSNNKVKLTDLGLYILESIKGTEKQ